MTRRILVTGGSGQLAGALADCNQSLALRANGVLALDSRGLVYLKMKRADAAIADYDAALAINPKKASSLYGRGLAKQMAGDAAGAMTDIAAAKAVQADIGEQFANWGLK